MRKEKKDKIHENKYPIDEVGIDYRNDNPELQSLAEDRAEQSTYIADYRHTIEEADNTSYESAKNLKHNEPKITTNPIQNSEETSENDKRYRPKYKVAILTLLLIFIAVCFFANIVDSSVETMAQQYNATYDSYNEIIAPAVMANVGAFNTPTELDTDTANEIAVLHLLITQTKEGYTSYDNKGNLMLSAEEMQSSAKQVFGSQYTLTPKNPSVETFYTFSPEENMYHISEITDKDMYTPYITSQNIDGDKIILQVGYIAPNDLYRTDKKNNNKPTLEKNMIYTIQRDSSTNDYYISTVQSS